LWLSTHDEKLARNALIRISNERANGRFHTTAFHLLPSPVGPSAAVKTNTQELKETSYAAREPIVESPSVMRNSVQGTTEPVLPILISERPGFFASALYALGCVSLNRSSEGSRGKGRSCHPMLPNTLTGRPIKNPLWLNLLCCRISSENPWHEATRFNSLSLQPRFKRKSTTAGS
jgi:hypothetical protein